jgi:hypothetical protein
MYTIQITVPTLGELTAAAKADARLNAIRFTRSLAHTAAVGRRRLDGTVTKARSSLSDALWKLAERVRPESTLPRARGLNIKSVPRYRRSGKGSAP